MGDNWLLKRPGPKTSQGTRLEQWLAQHAPKRRRNGKSRARRRTANRRRRKATRAHNQKIRRGGR